jgi:putative flippase GtrA
MASGVFKRTAGLILNREVIVYIIAGVLTTLVNLIVFTIMSRLVGTDMWWVSNFPAISAAVVFAFWVNRRFVFRSHGPVWHELFRFLTGRLFTALVFETGAMFLFYNLFGWDQVISFGNWELAVSKLLTQVLVMTGNYVISKLFVFNRIRKNG